MFLISILTFFFLNSFGQDNYTYIHKFNAEAKIKETINPDGSITIYYSIPSLNFRKVRNDHGTFYRISIPDHIPGNEPGMPELPVFSRLLRLPGESRIRIKVSEVRSTKVFPRRRVPGVLYPAQESGIKGGQDDRKQFRIDNETYKKRGLLSSDTISYEYLGKSRDHYLANLYIKPVRYNPGSNSLEVIRSMKIDIHFEESGSKSSQGGSVLFNTPVSRSVMNPDLVTNYTNKPVGMVILADTIFRKQLEPYVLWKTQKGIRTKVLYKGISGNSYAELKEAIKRIYQSSTSEEPAPDYLLIVGDVKRIPSGTGLSGNITDLYYGEFDGNGDYLPEMYTGRIPASDTAELRSVLKKIIDYEKFEFPGSNTFFKNALATTGYDVVHKEYMNGQINYQVGNYFTPENNISERHFNHSEETDIVKVNEILEGQKKNIIDTLINGQGLSFINYSGHGSSSGWLNLNILVSDTAKLKNTDKYPFIISNACLTGQYGKSSSFANRMVLSQGKGAIGFIGCSNDSFWDEDYYWAVGLGPIIENPVYENKGQGIFDRLFHTHGEAASEWYYTAGQIVYSGNLSVSASNSSRKKYYWETYNLVGDPSMIPVIGQPSYFTTVLPDTLPKGIRTLTLSADPFSYVAISQFDTLWDATFAGISGAATISIPSDAGDSCLVVITGQNKYPLIKKIYFSDIDDEFLNLDGFVINDNSGNSNGKADYGESFYLDLSLTNLGNTAAENINIKLQSASEWLTIEKDTVAITRIEEQSFRNISERLLLRVKGNVPDLGICPLTVTIKSDNSEKTFPLEIQLHAPELSISTFTINDTKTGNGDFIADPGETFDLSFIVKNTGSSDASGDFHLTSANQGINIDNPSVKSGVIRQSENTYVPVRVQLSDDLTSGGYIQLSSELVCWPFIINQGFTLRIGKVRESFEGGSFKVFPWINNSSIPWIITDNDASDGIRSARSGQIDHKSSTVLSIKVIYSANDTLRFRYKVSSEQDFDSFSFKINGKEYLKKRSGEVPWTTVEIPVSAGLNDLVWSYSKDGSVTLGDDCALIDLIDFAGSGTVRYIRKDLRLEKIEEPVEINSVGQGDLRVKVINSGTEIVNSFNLAYSVNKGVPVIQSFPFGILPGRDTSVVFSRKMDLSKYGLFNVTVFGINNEDDYLRNDTLKFLIENTDINESIGVYPNPFSNHLNVYINSQLDDVITLSIMNVNGLVLYTSEKSIVTGGNTIPINKLMLKPGHYFLKIKGTRINKTVSLIKIRE